MKLDDIWIPDQHVDDLLCSAFEGGSTYWATLVSRREPTDTKPVYLHEWPMAGGAVVLASTEGDEINGVKEWTLDREACERGMRVMADKYPRHWGAFMAGNDDAETGDVYLQCCLFGEIVFG